MISATTRSPAIGQPRREPTPDRAEPREPQSRAGRRGSRHGDDPGKDGALDGRSEEGRRLRVTARCRHVADVELERFEAAEAPAGQARDDVEPVALVDGLGDVRPTERDPVEDVALAPERQLACARRSRRGRG